jgi:LPS export ABC transporter protein LptC
MRFIKNIKIILVATVFVFGCESNFKNVKKSTLSEFTPTGIAENLNLKYTDSGKIRAILKSPKMMDYSSVSYPFTVFPNGIFVTLFDKKNRKTFVKSNTAFTYKNTDIIDLRGNVKIYSEQNQSLETQQLYYDQKNEWFYTEQPFTMTDPKKGHTEGQGIDFNKDFSVINYQRVTGVVD